MSQTQSTILGDKEILTDILNQEKELLQLYGTAITESSCANMRRVAQDNMLQCFQDQYGVFDNMATRGFYQVKLADLADLNQAKQDYSRMQSQL